MLIPVIVQDVATNNVLMLAYADKTALKKTLQTGYMHYYSRSRKKLWKKGETSGNIQRLVSLHYDCDRDAILARVVQKGVACHLKRYSCFSREVFGIETFIHMLEEIIRQRLKKKPRGSYTVKLAKDKQLLLKKVLEEAAEFALASIKGKREEKIWEAADVFYHILVALAADKISLSEVESHLAMRHKPDKKR